MDNFSQQLSESYSNLVEKLNEWINTFILQLPNLFIALILGVGAYFLTTYIRKASVKTSRKFTKNRTVLNLVSNLSAVVFGVIILFIILSVLNLDDTINKILATAGVLGLAVGLALQDPMNNLFSGVFMSVRDLYKIGDIVETNGYFGVIRDIDLRATKLRLPTGQDVVIPNKEVIQSPLTNYNSSGERRVDIDCGVTYDADLQFVEQLVRDTISKIDTRILEKPIDFIYNEFGGSSINFTARFWIDTCTQKDFLMERSKGIKRIKRAFDENGITIPFPIRTLDFGIEGGKTLRQMLPSKENGELVTN